MKTIIIGGVAAGMSAASKLKRLDPNAEIIVYEKGHDLSYGGCGMPYFLGDIITDEDRLIARTKAQFEKKGIQVFTGHEVLGVMPDKKTIKIKNIDSQEILTDKYDKLVVATGTKANRTHVPGSDEVDVYVLNQLEDARRIKEAMDGVLEIAIIGGGYIGLEIAENFAHLGVQVHIVEMAKQLLVVYDKEVAKKAKQTLENIGVNIYLNEGLKSYQNKQDRIAVNTNQRTLNVDMVIESIGVKPNTEFIKNTGIEMLKNGAIVTNDQMETNIKDIYAAGDCVAYNHLITGQKTFVPLGTHANKTGRIIAENISGNHKLFKGIIGSNIIKIDDYAFAKTGVGMDEAKRLNLNYDYVDITAKNQSGYYPGAESIFVRLVFDKETKVIKGAQLYGKKGISDRINIMALAILNEVTAENFAQSDFAYAPPFSPVWDPLLIAANQIKE
ncbi:MAG TPA: CoA-disulfide reductase [Candidatus Izemoplasmatales bacterium]|nr:CoA-disulfide reductase [Candidatus Izemoplasmatales bacterium]